ncbi:MAG: acyltransferase family protein [Candidatus Nanopelagicales bacterium]
MSGTLTREVRSEQARPAARRRRRAGLPHLVGLDGLRAIAVLAVIVYHAGATWLPGGFLGVDVFFVLSGFLITSLLLIELDSRGRVDLGRFYLRRARRLLPALLAVLLFSAILVAFLATDVAAGFRHDLPGALFYYSNWLNIVSQTSYFEFIGRPPMLQHLWSLAVEEQFYLVWPLVMLLAYRVRGARGVAVVALSGAVLSTMAMVVGSVRAEMPAAHDPSRLYFGTDTHAMGVLVGAALAVIWRPGRTAAVVPRQVRRVISAVGLTALVVLMICFAFLSEYSVFLYRGGFLVVSVVTAVVVAAASHRGVAFGRILGVRPLRYLGERSYGLYLWHWPLFIVLRPGQDMALTGLPAFALRMVLLLIVAEASYRYLELPARRGALGRLLNRAKAGELARPGRLGLSAIAAGTALLAVVAFRVATAEAPAMAAGPGVQAADQLPEDARLAPIPPARDQVDMAGVATRAELNWQRRLLNGSALARQRAAALTREAAEGYGMRATAFGDSVLLGAAPALEKGPFNLDLHARVGEQADATAADVVAKAQAGGLADVAIVHTGNNGIVTAAQLEEILTSLAAVPRVVLVNTNVPRAWSAPNNKRIAAAAEQHPNVRLVDWYKISVDHSTFFSDDGVHLSWTGAQAYAQVIAEAAAAR